MDTLADVPLWFGLIVPQRTHTDDYPDLYLELALPDQIIRYQSPLQGAAYCPWSVAINVRRFLHRGDCCGIGAVESLVVVNC